MFELEKIVRKNVLKLRPYSSARDEFQGEASVFLDANENPYPSSYNRYPDPQQLALKKKIAALKQLPAEQILLGNGSDEPIDLLFRAFCEPGIDKVLIPRPTYGMYTVSAEINDVRIQAVPLTNDFDLDVDATMKAADSKTKLIFLCSPNNPSGNLLSAEKVQDIISRFHGIVVVDEAYIDFTGTPGFLPLLNRYPNLVVLQTLSKAWGLAGIRLGMCFASQPIISLLNKIKPPYNISTLSQEAALEALNHEQQKNEQVEQLIAERKKLEIELKKNILVSRVYPSDANFLLVKVSNAKNIYDKLVKKGIIVRDRSNVVLCEECLRITVGTPEENKILLSELMNL